MTDEPKRKKLEASPEVTVARQDAEKAQPTIKVKKNARSRWLLEVAKEAHAKGGTWATLGTMTYRFERVVHPHTGKALVQLGATVDLVEVEPQEVLDVGGNKQLVYWARRRGQAQKILAYPPYVLAIVTSEHTAGGTAAGERAVPEKEAAPIGRDCDTCRAYAFPRWDCVSCGGTGIKS